MNQGLEKGICHVNLSPYFSLRAVHQDVVDSWKWVVIWDCNFVKFPITGGEPWSIRAQIGVGTQVKGASTQQSHHKCEGKEKDSATYSDASPSDILKLSSSSVSKTPATTIGLFASNAALALSALVKVTFLHASAVGLPLFPRGQLLVKWPV